MQSEHSAARLNQRGALFRRHGALIEPLPMAAGPWMPGALGDAAGHVGWAHQSLLLERRPG